MSLQVDGVWKGGVWASTPWAAGVWREGAPSSPPYQSGGGGGIQTGGGERYYPYKKWWKLEQGKRFKKLKAAAEKKIASIELELEKAKEAADLAKSIEAIDKAMALVAAVEKRLRVELDALAELELEEFAIIWAIYGHSIYLR